MEKRQSRLQETAHSSFNLREAYISDTAEYIAALRDEALFSNWGVKVLIRIPVNDFDDLNALLEMIDTDVCRQFMEICAESKYEEIRESACEWVDDPPKVDTERPYYKYNMEEYAELKRKLGI